MAKATKAAAKKKPASKTTTKAPAKAKASVKPPAKAAKAASKPAPKPAAKKASVPPKAAAAKPTASGETKAPKSEAKATPKIDASQLHAHPEAKLTQREITALYTKLIEEKTRVISGFDRHVQEALADDDVLADEIDIAQRSTDQAWLFRFADKERKLLIEIDGAIEKMRNGDYGVCEGTDEAIGFKRLELRPWTRYSVAYKEMLEREKAQQAR